MRAEKQFLLDQIKEKIQSSNSMIVTNYKLVTPNNAWDFRSKLRELSSSFEVVKKTIFLKAAKECGFDVKLEELGGHIGVIFTSDDAVGPAKQIYEFNKENGAEINVLYGILEGKRCSEEDVKALSMLPNMSEMRSQFIATLEAPMSQTVSVMQSLIASVIYCLDNKVKQTS
jgi:large subunit ribosomal protein L10